MTLSNRSAFIFFYLPLVLANDIMMTASVRAENWTQWGGLRRDFTVPEIGRASQWQVRWQRNVGVGKSGVLALHGKLITMEARGHEGQKFEECYVAMDSADGRETWRHCYDTARHEDQETFGGTPVGPQATPVYAGNLVIGIGFAGDLRAVRVDDGTLVWSLHLVRDLGAIPVQFGFSASPIVHNGKLYVAAGGESAGLLCMDPKDGSIEWKCGLSGEASYATPVVQRIGESRSVIVVTRDEIVAVDDGSGSPLWRYPMPRKGLTNVPTPLVLDGGRLLAAGQGLEGARLLAVSVEGGRYDVRQIWHNSKAGFFCCNWIAMEGCVVGSDGSLLLVLDLESGAFIDRRRGYGDANLIRAGDDLLALHGDGYLTTLRLSTKAVDRAVSAEASLHSVRRTLKVVDHRRLADARCWTAPSGVPGAIYTRADGMIGALHVPAFDDSGKATVPPAGGQATDRSTWPAPPNLRPGNNTKAFALLDEIVAAFERGGEQAAFRRYLEIRREASRLFTSAARLELANLARQQGLVSFERAVIEHGVEDFPESSDIRARRDALKVRAESETTESGGASPE